MLIDSWHNNSKWLLLLLPFEWLYKILRYCHFIYWTKIRNRLQIETPILVVGNITLGGAGKTPAVIALARELSNKGLKVGIISRGYKRKGNKRAPLEVLKNSRATESGDEPLLLARLSKCPIFVCANRYLAAKSLLARHSVDLIISDDGLQHYAMKRNIEVAVVDAAMQFGNRHCFPVGPLREPLDRLKSVDIILMNLVNIGNREYNLPQEIQGGPPIFSMRYSKSSFIKLGLDSGNLSPLEFGISKWKNKHKGKNIHAIAGIAQPNNFFGLLKSYDINFTPHIFANHHSYKPQDIDFGNNSVVIMTEKDAVKCIEFNKDDLWALKIEVSLDEKIIKAILGQLANGKD